MSHAKFGSLPRRSRSQHYLPAKPCSAHNFVIWSQILKLFYIIDHHIDRTCRTQHLGRFLTGQGHSMTIQLNCFQPITLLFEVDLKTISHEWSPYWDDMSRATFGLLPWRPRSQHDLAAKSCLAQNFVGFYNYFWQTTSLRPITIRGALPGSDRLVFWHFSFLCDLFSNSFSLYNFLSIYHVSLFLFCIKCITLNYRKRGFHSLTR